MSLADEKLYEDFHAAVTAYEVGRGKPPLGTRFAKGKSGNPRGKPRGTRNKLPHLKEERLKDIVLMEAYRTIKLTEGDREVKLPVVQAIVRRLAVDAVKGDQRSQEQFTKMLSAIEHERKALHDKLMDRMMDYKINWNKELARREQLGLDLPDPVPHPDQITIDVMSGTVHVRGPWIKEEADLLKKAEAIAQAEGKDLLEFLYELRDEAKAGKAVDSD